MPQTDQTIGICLVKLAPKEEAVLKRVVTFSGAQGRNYTLTNLENANVLVASAKLEDATLRMKSANAVLVSIVDQPGELPGDVIMLRPLLVTRVMRALDEARKLLLAVDDAGSSDSAGSNPASAEVTVQTQVEVPVELPADIDVPAGAAIVAPVVLEAPRELDSPLADATHKTIDAAEQIAEVVQGEEAVQDVAYHHRALVVDDSAAIRKQLELELREAGIAADFAEDGEQALQKVSSGNHYDLIFLDIIMPGIDGYETCRQMRQISTLKKTPIIMLSAKTSPLDEVQGVIAGASTYLTKPVKSEHLQKTLQRVSMWLDNFSR